MSQVKTIINPTMDLLAACRTFADDAKKNAKVIAEIGKQEGYDFIQGYAQGLLFITEGEARAMAAMLTQPEWIWRDTSDPKTKVFGINYSNGFMALGTYNADPHTTDKSVRVCDIDDSDLEVFDFDVDDPRTTYTSTRIKQKVWRKRFKEYYLIDACKDRKALEEYYTEDKILESPRRLFMRDYEAYVILAGPFKKASQARAAKRDIH